MTEFAYNNAVHSFTKIILFFALYEQHFCMSLNTENNISREEINAADQQEMNSTADQCLKRLQKI